MIPGEPGYEPSVGYDLFVSMVAFWVYPRFRLSLAVPSYAPMTYREALAKRQTPTPDADGFWYLHRTSRPKEYPWRADDGSYHWCRGVYMEGKPTDAEVMAWSLVTVEDFAAEDWDCWEFVF